MDVQTITLTDELGRSIDCYVEHTLELAGETYVLLLPVDIPVEIFTWPDADAEEPIPVSDETEIEQVFEVASAVLAEQNLRLKRTAIALTAEGDLPEMLEESPDNGNGTSGDDSDGEEFEELQMLASFYFQEQEYTIYTPLDPLLILARLDDGGTPHLLTDAEYLQIEPMLPMLEDQLFETLD